ncbi:metalloprotease [Curtobacterium citreum]|uniref:Neutral metalloproteinase n=1 Tax=Curtobacterium citreum TaxID=2036 RepID=A0ABT2HFK3_9MICO|nr:M4 family metallopeptidase [Curtobacterium citreum]MCS6522045.1 M4 family metallopeptidase [Curtobacterium citreum]TQJ27437.1 thermolysin metallopeptidase-like protein [Curtobacterium citreum]GGL77941.1 metalloprotease [Curtobacterium citreum]
MTAPDRIRSVVPPYLLRAVADAAEHPRAAAAARTALGEMTAVAAPKREHRIRPQGVVGTVDRSPQRTIADAAGGTTLPGRVVRREGEPDTDDAATDEAYAGLGATHAFWLDVFGRASVDGAGLPLDATVHYGQDYDNAYWDGQRMVFGDGDGEVFNRFTIALDVIGHELAHGVTQHTADLTYEGQSGALNESVSDVFGSLVAQYTAGQTVDQASWLIGEGLFTDAVHGVALRSMRAPGTAYDDPVLGKDPQPATMAGYVQTTEDSGGVHVNSGIPNHAFFLAATAIGGRAWEGAGAVWWDALVSPSTTAGIDFAGFAGVTLDAASARFGAGSTEWTAVRDAWRTVGVHTAS